MNGRNIFKKYYFIINVLSAGTQFLPKVIFEFLYNITSISEGKIALLIRYLFVKKYSNKCGKNIFIGRNVVLKNLENLSLGSNISIHSFNYIDAAGGIDIGKNVSIANMSSMISFDHSWDDLEQPIKYNKVKFKKITICEDVWIGANVKILGGVKVNKRSIVAAGAVINKDVEQRTIVGGIPAKKIKSIE